MDEDEVFSGDDHDDSSFQTTLLWHGVVWRGKDIFVYVCRCININVYVNAH